MPIFLVWNFIKKHWKAVVAFVVILLAFIAGRASVPTQPEHVEAEAKVVEKKVIDEALVQAEVDRRVKELETKLRKHVVEKKVTKKDGTVEEIKITDLNIDKKEKEVEVKEVEKIVTKTEFVDRVVEKKVVMDAPRKDWIVGPVAALNVREFGISNGALQLGQVGFGAQVQRRVLGDVYLGLSGVHTGQVNLSLSYQF